MEVRSGGSAQIVVSNSGVQATVDVAVAFEGTCGDLNDTEHSVTNTLLTADPSYRLFASSRSGIQSDVGLYSSSSLQEYRSLRDVSYTHVFKGRHETLDHILVSEQFYDYSKNRRWSFKELRTYNDFVDDEDKVTSDHGVVTSTFVYNPYKK